MRRKSPRRWGKREALLAALALGATAATPGEPAAEQLFNGHDLSGFTTWLRDTGAEDPRGVFTVRNGAIRVSGEGFGYLATVRAFKDFVLTLEFRWGDQAGLEREALGRSGKAFDSGVFLNATGPDGNSHDGDGAFMAGVECNLFEGACGDILLIRGDGEDGELIAPRVTFEASVRRDAEGFAWWEPGGEPVTLERWGRVNARGKSPDWRDVQGARSPGSPERPPGEWNELEVRCREGTIAVTLNGRVVNRVTDVHPAGGKVLLQCEGAEVWFRNLGVRRL